MVNTQSVHPLAYCSSPLLLPMQLFLTVTSARGFHTFLLFLDSAPHSKKYPSDLSIL